MPKKTFIAGIATVRANMKKRQEMPLEERTPMGLRYFAAAATGAGAELMHFEQ